MDISKLWQAARNGVDRALGVSRRLLGVMVIVLCLAALFGGTVVEGLTLSLAIAVEAWRVACDT